MYYEVYVDSLLMLHIGLNYYLLALVNLLLYQIASHGRLLIGALLGALCAMGPVFLPIPSRVGVAVGFLLSTWVMCKFTFRVTERKQLLRIMEKMTLISLVLGGVLRFLLRWTMNCGETFHGVLGTLILATVVYEFVRRGFVKKREKGSDCKVILYNGEAKVEMNALIDSGNTLVEPISGRPVSVAESKALEEIFNGEWPQGYRIVPFCSVGKKHGLLKAYLVNSIIVEVEGCCKEYKDVYIGENQEFFRVGSRYHMILNPDVLKGES